MLLGDSSFSFVPFATQEHDAIVIPTAQSMTFSSGTPTIIGSAVVTPTAQQMTISQGDVTVEVVAAIPAAPVNCNCNCEI